MVSVSGRIRLKETLKNPEFGSVDRIDNNPVREKGEPKFFTFIPHCIQRQTLTNFLTLYLLGYLKTRIRRRGGEGNWTPPLNLMFDVQI